MNKRLSCLKPEAPRFGIEPSALPVLARHFHLCSYWCRELLFLSMQVLFTHPFDLPTRLPTHLHTLSTTQLPSCTHPPTHLRRAVFVFSLFSSDLFATLSAQSQSRVKTMSRATRSSPRQTTEFHGGQGKLRRRQASCGQVRAGRRLEKGASERRSACRRSLTLGGCPSMSAAPWSGSESSVDAKR